MLAPEHVNLRSHPKGLEIQAGLDREPGSRQHPPVVVCLVIVEMHSIPMNALAEAMAGPVKDMLAISGLLQHRARRAIDFPSTQVASAERRVFHERHGGIAGPRDRLERPWKTRRSADATCVDGKSIARRAR